MHDGRQVTLPREVQLVIDKGLIHRRAGTLKEYPVDLYPILLEFLFHQAVGIDNGSWSPAHPNRIAHSARGDPYANELQGLLGVCAGNDGGNYRSEEDKNDLLHAPWVNGLK